MQHIFFINTSDDYSFNIHYQQALSYIPKEFRTMAVSSYNAGQTSIAQLRDEISSLSFGSEYKVVVLKNYDKLATKKEFSNLLESVPQTCFLFLQKDTYKTPANLSTFIKQNRAITLEINIYEITVDIIVKRMVDFFKTNHIAYEMDAVETYASTFVLQSQLLKNELDKVLLYLSKGNKVFNKEVLDDILSLSPSYNIFELVRLFFSKNTKKKMLYLQNFLLTNPSNFIVLQTLLTKEAKKIILFKELKAMAMDEALIFKELGLSYYKAKETLISLSKNFKLDEIKNITNLLYSIEMALKTSSLHTEKIDKPSINLKAFHLLLKTISYMEHRCV